MGWLTLFRGHKWMRTMNAYSTIMLREANMHGRATTISLDATHPPQLSITTCVGGAVGAGGGGGACVPPTTTTQGCVCVYVSIEVCVR